MIIEILTAATAGSTIVLGLAINASRAQVRGLAKELKRKTTIAEKQQVQIWDLTAETKAEAKLKNINAYETYEELKAKIAYDAELFNGFAVEVPFVQVTPMTLPAVVFFSLAVPMVLMRSA